MNEKKVEKVLDKIRPYIQRDGGDVTLEFLEEERAEQIAETLRRRINEIAAGQRAGESE